MSLFLTAFAILASVIGSIYVTRLLTFQYTYWRRRGVPHINGAPIVGHFLPVARKKISFFEHLKAMHFRFPKARYYGFYDMNRPALAIRDPELVRDICISAFDCFPNHRTVMVPGTDPIISRHLMALCDDKWRTTRVLMTSCFTISKLKSMVGLVDSCTRRFIDHLSPKEFESKDLFSRLTCDVIASVAFGLEVDSMENPENEFFKCGNEISNITFSKLYKVVLANKMPFLRKCIDGGILSRRTIDYFSKLIEETIQARRDQGIARPDMIQLMMEAMEEDKNFDMGLLDVVGNSFAFFFGGFEPTSAFAALIAFELAGNPKIQEKLRVEIDEYFQGKEDEEMTYDEVNELKYLDMVLNETLRFYPPAMVTDRICSKEFQLPEAMEGCPPYKIEQGMMIFFSMPGIQHDPEYYVDPEKFDPERFSDERKHEINPYAFLPFGLGPRNCIANKFAMMEIKILFIYLLKNFELILPESIKYPMVFDKKKLITRPEGGFLLKIEKR